MRRGYLDTPEGQVFYRDDGAGEPLVLLHHTPRSSSMFLDLMPFLAPEYRTISIDLLGYGDSDLPPGAADGTFDHFALAGNVIHVLDALGIEKAHLFGKSTGAVIATAATAEAPERVQTLTVTYPLMLETDYPFPRVFDQYQRPGKTSFDGSHLLALWMKAYGEIGKWWLHDAPSPRDSGAEALLQRPSPFRSVCTFMTEQELTFIDRWIADYPRVRIARPLYESMFANSVAERAPIATLRRVTVPTLHIEPDSPYSSPFVRRGSEVAEHVGNCMQVTLRNSDDNMVEFQAGGLAAEMLPFLRQHAMRAA